MYDEIEIDPKLEGKNRYNITLQEEKRNRIIYPPRSQCKTRRKKRKQKDKKHQSKSTLQSF